MLTDFEYKVLGLINRDRLPLGDRLIKYVACARRLEKKGYASKGRNWYLTEKGEKALLDPQRRPTTRAPAEAGGDWDCTTCKKPNIDEAQKCWFCDSPRPGG